MGGQARTAERKTIDGDACIDIEWMDCMQYAYGFYDHLDSTAHSGDGFLGCALLSFGWRT